MAPARRLPVDQAAAVLLLDDAPREREADAPPSRFGRYAGLEELGPYLDRDTRPDFASTVMIPAIQQFLSNPNDIDSLTKNIEAQKKTIFASD